MYLIPLFLLSFHSSDQDSHPKRVLILPFMVEQAAAEPWEGLAMTLAFQSTCSEQTNLVPLTAVRRKLNEYGLSIVTPVSLATRMKLAKALGADQLIYGFVDPNQTRLILLDVASKQLTPYEQRHDKERDPQQVLDKLGQILNLKHESVEAFDLYRVWASTYFVEELEASRDMMTRLLEHEGSDWLFMQEYLDLFGNPSNSAEEAADLAYWRDLFYNKTHYSHALDVSKRVLKARHNPSDFLSHARILLETENLKEACTYLARAESFGFTNQDTDILKKRCEGVSTP